ncbi:unnamed protein product [Microthlaspi erraticum]|uniref:Uncharacterized protein n=1 Tax=Microthlaspi erraticum TaxID=1685480 RepID=A0A6D2IAR3_9BRAS|nr:unnamed protein product [Microthlaspi erraticum]CAA7032920.1 unnamed protein product [Microthlaspi erraticum]
MQTKSRAHIQLQVHWIYDVLGIMLQRTCCCSKKDSLRKCVHIMWLLPFSWGQHCLVGDLVYNRHHPDGKQTCTLD